MTSQGTHSTESTREPSLPEVFSFLDYREYIRAFYEHRKSINPSFSYEMFSRMASLGRANLYAIATGRRKLNSKVARDVAKACRLESAGEEYFVALVLWQECDDAKMKQMYWERLCALAPNQGFYVLKAQEQSFLGTWYVLALLELVRTDDFQPDPTWISERLGKRMSAQHVERTINELLKFGFLQKEGDNLIVTNKTIVCGRDSVSRDLIVNYHAKNIPMALHALSEVESELMEISSMSIGIDPEQLPELKNRIRAFRKEILQYAEHSMKTKEVYQLNIQFFPMTRKVKS